MFAQCNIRNINEHYLSERTKAKMKGSSCKGGHQITKILLLGDQVLETFQSFLK